jgi:hypothetical protein
MAEDKNENAPASKSTKKKTGTSKSAPKKNALVDLNLTIINSMHGVKGLKTPDFPRRFHVLTDDQGSRVPIEELDGQVCKYVKEMEVSNAILSYCHRVLGGVGPAAIDYGDAVKCMQMWRGLTEPLDRDSIKPVVQKSTDSKCWHRLPWDLPREPGETPTFDELFSRMKENQAPLMAWIGSLFIPEADRQQYVWMYGDGQNGKGRLVNFLARCMGPSYGSEVPPAKHGDSRFWTAGLMGKRLIAFPDCTMYSFPTQGIFKSLTGGDKQRIERKGCDSFSADLDCKFIFLSNTEPTLTGSTADRRRVIFISMAPIEAAPIPQAKYDGMLWDEGPDFLAKCIAEYRRLSPDHGAIPTTTIGIDEIVSEAEMPIVNFIRRYFLLEEDAEFECSTMQSLFNQERIAPSMKKQIVDFLLRAGITRVKKKAPDGTRTWTYRGIRLSDTGKKFASGDY